MSNGILKKIFSSVCVALALAVLFAPLWWAFTREPLYLLLFLVSWIPSGLLVKLSEIFD